MIPKINLLYYKNILDNVMSSFFDEFNEGFENINGNYVLCKTMTRNKLKIWLRNRICEEILKYTSEFDIVRPEYFFIIGSCLPKDNILLDYTDRGYFPQKLTSMINSDYCMKYSLREDDIDIDITKFNCIFEDVFNDMFSHDKMKKYLGKDRYRNVFMLKHNRLDCYMMYRSVKLSYGSVNTVNIHKMNIEKMKDIMYSVNEDIDKYIMNKKDIVKSGDLSFINGEIRQYIDNCMKETLNG